MIKLGKVLRRLLDPVVCPFCGHVQARGSASCAACQHGIAPTV